MAPAASPARRRVDSPGRIAGLVGIRELAALFVVMNHIFLRAWPGYPVDPAPFWALVHLRAVRGDRVHRAVRLLAGRRAGALAGGGSTRVAGFARRRAWRILPPYWAALAFSLS